MRGTWTIVSLAPSVRGNRYVNARCSCGREKRVRARHIETGVSLGCRSCAETKHGHSKRRTIDGVRSSSEYYSYRSMLQRCLNERCEHFGNYGGRGITVCDRWQGPQGFENFLSDMGPRQAGTTLDREHNDRGYEPGNCRWATRPQQAQNSRATRLTVDVINEIRGRIEHGESQASVHRRMGLSRSMVSSIWKMHTWANVG